MVGNEERLQLVQANSSAAEAQGKAGRALGAHQLKA